MRRLLIACVALVAATSCDGAAEEKSDAAFDRDDVRMLVLTPGDLERGYEYGDDSACGSFAPEAESEEFVDFVRDANPVGCSAELQYVWGTTGVPRGVTSAAVVFDSAEDARRGLRLRDELISFTAGESPRDFSSVEGLGDEASAFRNRGYDDIPPGAGMIWRNGNMVAVVFAGGMGLSRERAPDVALGLARKQQARIENPKPPPDTKDEERQLELDDPELAVPVYWLGTKFDPPGALPALRLYGAGSYPGGRAEIGFEAELDYERGVRIHLWKPEAWERAKDGLPGRLVLADGCTRETPVSLARGRAVIYAGYAKPSQPPCPRRAPDLYFANATFDDVVVRINAPLCFYPCSKSVGKDPYNSAAGMQAVLRGLRLRR